MPMTDLCPSCKEPVDHPSGDGCATMTRHQPHQCPSPEAIVRSALERAAQTVQMCIWGYHWRHDDFGDVDPEELAEFIRSLASDPAEVAAIIKKAGEDRG